LAGTVIPALRSAATSSFCSAAKTRGQQITVKVVWRRRNSNQVKGEQGSCLCHLVLQCFRVGRSFILPSCMVGSYEWQAAPTPKNKIQLYTHQHERRMRPTFRNTSVKVVFFPALILTLFLLCLIQQTPFSLISANSLCAHPQKPLAQGNLEPFGGVKYIHSCSERRDFC